MTVITGMGNFVGQMFAEQIVDTLLDLNRIFSKTKTPVLRRGLCTY